MSRSAHSALLSVGIIQHQIRCYQKGYTHPVPLVGAPGVRALPLNFGFEDWEDTTSIAKAIGNAKLSFDDLVVDDGQVVLPFQRVEPLVLQLDDSDQGPFLSRGPDAACC